MRVLFLSGVALVATGIAALSDPQLIAREYRGQYGLQAGTAGLRLPVLKSVVLPPNARPLNPASGVDALAMEVARAWVFDPATRNGQAVASLVTLEFSFMSR